MKSDAVGAHIAKVFMIDRTIFAKHCDLDGKCKKLMSLFTRHVFQRRSNKLLFEAFDESMGRFTPAIRDHIQKCARTLRVTQLVEDLNGVASNHTCSQMVRQFRRPATSWAAMLQKDVVANRHKFENVQSAPVAPGKSSTLP